MEGMRAQGSRKAGTLNENPWVGLVLRVLGICGALLAWWLVSSALGQTRLPSPLTVAKAFIALPFPSKSCAAAGISKTGGISIQLTYTTVMVLVSVVLGGGSGYLLGLATARYKPLREFLELVVEVIRAVPPSRCCPSWGCGWVGARHRK